MILTEPLESRNRRVTKELQRRRGRAKDAGMPGWCASYEEGVPPLTEQIHLRRRRQLFELVAVLLPPRGLAHIALGR